MKRMLLFAAPAAALLLASCNPESEVQEYGLSDVFGYTYSAAFTSSSGTQLAPEITIYDGIRLDWTMSSGSMEVNEYWYVAEPHALNSWNLFWLSKAGYGKDEVARLSSEEASGAASMCVRFGIESPSSVSVLVLQNGENDNEMARMPLTMRRTSSDRKPLPDGGGEADYPTELREPPYGTYYGDSVADGAYFSGMVSVRDTVAVLEDGSVSFESETWGTWTFPDVDVAEEFGVFTVSGEGTAVMSMGGSGGGPYPTTLSACVSGGALTAELAAPGVMGGTTIRFESRSADGN
ncbi:MAG: hypothetical protein K2H09_04105 [Treponemataceae bacterium]|nr:hypothetical protein [Treponemataceae bacterium]